MTRARVLVSLCVVALVPLLAGCRSSQPLAPKHEVDGVLSNLGLYCGEAIQLRSFGPHRSRVSQLDSAASAAAAHLVRVMRANPAATYLGQSMRAVVQTAASETAECRLTRASAELSHAVGRGNAR